MSDTQLIQKMIARDGNIQSYKMRLGTIEDKDWNKIAETINDLSTLKFNINSNIRTIQGLEVKARKLKNKGLLDLLVIDYLQLLRNKDKFNSREQEVADISRRLKLLSLELNIPIIVLSQLNRNASNNEPNQADLRESGSLEQDADNIIFLYPEENEEDIINIKVAKQRAGETGKIKVRFMKQISQFRNLIEE
jgi:replicative DNA helicase